MRTVGMAAGGAAILLAIGGGLWWSLPAGPGKFPGPGGGLSFAPDSAPQPKVEVVGGTVHNFGNMQVGETRRHAFTFRNVGQGDLRLQAGETSCKCTISKLDHDRLPPGAEARIELEWKPTEESSSFRKTALIHTTDRERPDVVLTIEGTVMRRLSIHPDPVTFGQVLEEQPAEARFLVHTPVDRDMKIAELEFTDAETKDYFAAEIVPADPARLEEYGSIAGWQVRMSLKPGLPLGPFRQTVRVTTNVPDSPPIDVHVLGTIAGEVEVVGGGNAWHKEHSALVLGQVAPAVGLRKSLKLLLKGKYKDLEALEVETSLPDVLRVELGKREKYNKVGFLPFEVVVPVGAPAAVCSGTKKEPFAEIRFYRPGRREWPLLKINVQLAVLKE